jgi:hypothetical protein
MGAIRVVARKRMVRVVVGAAVLLGVAGLGTLMWDGPMGTVLRYSVARSCPVDAPAAACVATLPATVTSAWTDYSEGAPYYETLLDLDVSGHQAGAVVSHTDAERLGIEEFATTPVEVTMFDGEVLEITDAGGETATTKYVLRPKLAAGQFLLLVLAAAALLAGGSALWRHRPSWVRPAVVTAAAGAVAGQLATVVTSNYVAVGWTVPILVSTYLVVAVLVAFLSTRRLREPFAGQADSRGIR